MVNIQHSQVGVSSYRQHTYDWSQLAVIIHDLGCQRRKTLQVQGGLLAGALVAIGVALALLVMLVGRHGRGLSGNAGKAEMDDESAVEEKIQRSPKAVSGRRWTASLGICYRDALAAALLWSVDNLRTEQIL